jgi:hypothetical protein
MTVLAASDAGSMAQLRSTGSPVYRAFSDTSVWNLPLPANAPLYSRSALVIAEISGFSSDDHPTLTDPTSTAYGQPIYWAAVGDKQYWVKPARGCRIPKGANPIRIPAGAKPATGSDAQMTVFSLVDSRVWNLSDAAYDAVNDEWSACVAVYVLSSNGLDVKTGLSDSTINKGHRGVPPPTYAARFDEVAGGAIEHVMKVALAKTAECYFFPMVGYESGRGGKETCEGLVLRIKPEINLAARGISGGALVIAQAMQSYGVVIGDTGNTHDMNLKLESPLTLGTQEWSDLGITDSDVFKGKLHFSDFVVLDPSWVKSRARSRP